MESNIQKLERLAEIYNERFELGKQAYSEKDPEKLNAIYKRIDVLDLEAFALLENEDDE